MAGGHSVGRAERQAERERVRGTQTVVRPGRRYGRTWCDAERERRSDRRPHRTAETLTHGERRQEWRLTPRQGQDSTAGGGQNSAHRDSGRTDPTVALRCVETRHHPPRPYRPVSSDGTQDTAHRTPARRPVITAPVNSRPRRHPSSAVTDADGRHRRHPPSSSNGSRNTAASLYVALFTWKYTSQFHRRFSATITGGGAQRAIHCEKYTGVRAATDIAGSRRFGDRPARRAPGGDIGIQRTSAAGSGGARSPCRGGGPVSQTQSPGETTAKITPAGGRQIGVRCAR